MESFDAAAIFMDDLLDFSSDIGEECEEDDDLDCVKTKMPLSSSFSLLPPCHVTEFVEEELEWISNKDAFPMVESFVDIMPNQPTSITSSTATTPSHHLSLVSVLENSSTSSMNSVTSSSGSTSRNTSCSAVSALISTFKVPGKARTKMGRKRRQDMLGQQWQCWSKQTKKVKVSSRSSRPSSTLGRKCLHCQSEKTPQWRAGPLGPKTLCNACGVRYKSGRLVPEYRPASSPTFSSVLHSNSHRKIVEMRKQKMMTTTTNDGMKSAEIS